MVGLLSFATTLFVYQTGAFTLPTQAPPDGNVATPLNTGATFQKKPGPIGATGYYDTDDPAYFLNPSNLSKLKGLWLGQDDTDLHRIKNVQDPIDPQDAVTKGYVDAVARGAGGSVFVPDGSPAATRMGMPFLLGNAAEQAREYASVSDANGNFFIISSQGTSNTATYLLQKFSATLHKVAEVTILPFLSGKYHDLAIGQGNMVFSSIDFAAYGGVRLDAYDNDLNLLWSKSVSSQGTTSIHGLGADSQGNSYIATYQRYSGDATLYTYSPSGVLLKSQLIQGIVNGRPGRLYVDTNDNVVMVNYATKRILKIKGSDFSVQSDKTESQLCYYIDYKTSLISSDDDLVVLCGDGKLKKISTGSAGGLVWSKQVVLKDGDYQLVADGSATAGNPGTISTKNPMVSFNLLRNPANGRIAVCGGGNAQDNWSMVSGCYVVDSGGTLISNNIIQAASLGYAPSWPQTFLTPLSNGYTPLAKSLSGYLGTSYTSELIMFKGF